MTVGVVMAHAPTSKLSRVRDKVAPAAVLMAGYDLMLATLIIIAGSQGVYRFVPPLLLWATIYLLVALKLAANLRALLSVLRANSAILAFPAVAFLSATWSEVPSHSLYSATQLAVTYLAGFWIGWRYRPNEIALIVVLALTPLITLSLINWATGIFGEVYSYTGGLLGIFSNKNTLGRISLLLGLAALGLLISGRFRPLRVTILLTVFTAAALALLLSKSATSIIFMLCASALFVALAMHRFDAGCRFAIAMTSILAVLAGCVLLALSNVNPMNEVLELFGKSADLTGRTFLWGTASRQIDTQPWLGVGFDAYWDSEAFLAADRIQGAFGGGVISFHNFVLDIWIAMGVPGLFAIFITLGAIAIAYLRYYIGTRSISAAMMLTTLVAAVGVALFNPLLHSQHGNMIVILVAFAVSARIETRRVVELKAANQTGTR